MALFLAVASPAPAQQPELASVLERAAAYVADFHRQLASIVVEERYIQDVHTPVLLTPPGGPGASLGILHRTLISDLLLVRPVGSDRYLEYRDVFDVDGQPVRDRGERLMDLFVAPSAQTAEQASRILAESARYNIGGIQRNVNTPVFPLMFLTADSQRRFVFKRAKDRAPKAATAAPADGAFRIAAEIWVIEYRERSDDTIIRTGRGIDLPTQGRFWIDPATGQVLMTELTVEDVKLRATIDVSYQSEPVAGLLVPIEMRERYDDKARGSRIIGRASYGRLRRFQVSVDEKLAPVIK
jgi:hypothetical protein